MRLAGDEVDGQALCDRQFMHHSVTSYIYTRSDIFDVRCTDVVLGQPRTPSVLGLVHCVPLGCCCVRCVQGVRTGVYTDGYVRTGVYTASGIPRPQVN